MRRSLLSNYIGGNRKHAHIVSTENTVLSTNSLLYCETLSRPSTGFFSKCWYMLYEAWLAKNVITFSVSSLISSGESAAKNANRSDKNWIWSQVCSIAAYWVSLQIVWTLSIRLSDNSLPMQTAKIFWSISKHYLRLAKASLGRDSFGSARRGLSYCFWFDMMCWLVNSNRNSRSIENGCGSILWKMPN